MSTLVALSLLDGLGLRVLPSDGSELRFAVGTDTETRLRRMLVEPHNGFWLVTAQTFMLELDPEVGTVLTSQGVWTRCCEQLDLRNAVLTAARILAGP